MNLTITTTFIITFTVDSSCDRLVNPPDLMKSLLRTQMTQIDFFRLSLQQLSLCDYRRQTDIRRPWSSLINCHALFQITILMHNSFILQQYVCYTMLLIMFRSARCSFSGGPIVSPQPLVSSSSVNSRTVCRWRADCKLYGFLQRVTIPEAVVIQLVLPRTSSVLLETC